MTQIVISPQLESLLLLSWLTRTKVSEMRSRVQWLAQQQAFLCYRVAAARELIDVVVELSSIEKQITEHLKAVDVDVIVGAIMKTNDASAN